jgi:hypothetical protein
MKRLIVVSAWVGFAVPIFWGILGFLAFNAPQNAMSDMFWDTVHETCPPMLIDGNSIFANFLATPLLNAALYGGVAFVGSYVFRAIAPLIHGRLSFGSRRIYSVLAIAGLCAVVPALFVDYGNWPVMALPTGAWVTIASTIICFTLTGQARNNAEN